MILNSFGQISPSRKMPDQNQKPLKSDIKISSVELLQILLAAMRAQHWNYWTSHWQAEGNTSYEDHLLFSRLYESLVEEIDTLAEKIVGSYGSEAVEACSQMHWTHGFIRSWSIYKCPYCRGLYSEKELQRLLKSFYNKLKGEEAMSLGLDDFIMSTASAHETNIYLLQQRLSKREAIRKASQRVLRKKVLLAGEVAPSGEKYFRDNPEKREVREFQESGQLGNLTKKEQRKGAPPTVVDIKDQPGGDEFSTLNRYVVNTEEPTDLKPKKKPSPKLAFWDFLE